MEANILRILVVLIGVALVAVVLVQQPKEGGIGAFTGGGGGSGASSTVFGAKGSGNFLFKLTASLVLAFVILIVTLVKVSNSDLGGSILSTPVAEAEAIPGASTTNEVPKAQTATTANAEEIPGAVQNTNAAEEIPGAVQNTNAAEEIPGAVQKTTTAEDAFLGEEKAPEKQ